jgi:hypothetical protein
MDCPELPMTPRSVKFSVPRYGISCAPCSGLSPPQGRSMGSVKPSHQSSMYALMTELGSTITHQVILLQLCVCPAVPTESACLCQPHHVTARRRRHDTQDHKVCGQPAQTTCRRNLVRVGARKLPTAGYTGRESNQREAISAAAEERLRS